LETNNPVSLEAEEEKTVAQKQSSGELDESCFCAKRFHGLEESCGPIEWPATSTPSSKKGSETAIIKCGELSSIKKDHTTNNSEITNSSTDSCSGLKALYQRDDSPNNTTGTTDQTRNLVTVRKDLTINSTIELDSSSEAGHLATPQAGPYLETVPSRRTAGPPGRTTEAEPSLSWRNYTQHPMGRATLNKTLGVSPSNNQCFEAVNTKRVFDVASCHNQRGIPCVFYGPMHPVKGGALVTMNLSCAKKIRGLGLVASGYYRAIRSTPMTTPLHSYLISSKLHSPVIKPMRMEVNRGEVDLYKMSFTIGSGGNEARGVWRLWEIHEANGAQGMEFTRTISVEYPLCPLALVPKDEKTATTSSHELTQGSVGQGFGPVDFRSIRMPANVSPAKQHGPEGQHSRLAHFAATQRCALSSTYVHAVESYHDNQHVTSLMDQLEGLILFCPRNETFTILENTDGYQFNLELHLRLWTTPELRGYLQRRGLSNEDIGCLMSNNSVNAQSLFPRHYPFHYIVVAPKEGLHFVVTPSVLTTWLLNALLRNGRALIVP
jgi:hypothetical protein